MFYLQLSTTVRQPGENAYAEVLNRMRVCNSTEEEITLLNTRCTSDLSILKNESPHWTTAPIITARKSTATALNSAAVVRNGEILGTVHVHSMPNLARAKQGDTRKPAALIFLYALVKEEGKSKRFTGSYNGPLPWGSSNVEDKHLSRTRTM